MELEEEKRRNIVQKRKKELSIGTHT